MFLSVLLIAAIAVNGAAGTSLRQEVETLPTTQPRHIYELLQHALPSKRDLGQLPDTPKLLPVYPGYASHFAYLYVGNPPQRQAVILDTASSWTVFPCTKCKNCGSHLNDYFDPSKSSSYKETVCDGDKCEIKNIYSTSQWVAYRGTDDIFIAGNDVEDVTNAKDYTFNLEFGCMASNNKDMREQAADGILGLAMPNNALPFQYSSSAHVDSVFSLCLRQGGGIFTLGGTDPAVASEGHTVSWTRLSNQTNPLGFWRVKVEKMQFESHVDKKLVDIGTPSDIAAMDNGKGAILDSATSQTYFPKSLGPSLAKAFKAVTGRTLDTRKSVRLSPEEVKKLPTLVIYFRDSWNNRIFPVKMPPSDYLETDGDGVYNIMLAATENSGAVFGSNFLDGYNVIFDRKNFRIGFVESACKYADFHDAPGTPPVENAPGGESCGVMKPKTECTAKCNAGTPHKENYLASGTQDWSDECLPEKRETRVCHMSCSAQNDEIAAPHSLKCPLEPWSECSNKCIQTKNTPVWKNGKCLNGGKQTRQCYASQCGTAANDYLIFIDMKFYMNAPWSSAVSEDVFNAVALIFNINPGNVEALVDTGAYVGYKKVQIQIRLRSKDYPKRTTALLIGESIVDKANEHTFPDELVYALNQSSYAQDFVDYSRFGWMVPGYDLVLLSATGFPISGKDRNPDYQIDKDDELNGSGAVSPREEQLKLLLTGVILAAFVIVGLLVYLYFRLRRQYWDLEKDKGLPGNLKAMWESYKAKKKLQKGYKKVRATEMTQTVGSPFEEDEFDAALDYADDVNG